MTALISPRLDSWRPQERFPVAARKKNFAKSERGLNSGPVGLSSSALPTELSDLLRVKAPRGNFILVAAGNFFTF